MMSDHKTTIPNIIGLGSPRAGTSTLYQILQSIDNVSVSKRKETNYWGIQQLKYNKNGISPSDYTQLFERPDAEFVADITPVYLHNPNSRKEITENLSDSKVIINIREPFSRFFSQFKHFSTQGRSPVDHGYKISEFNQYAIKALDNFEQGNIIYKDWGSPQLALLQSLYADVVKEFISNFGKSKVLILDFQDITTQGLWIEQIETFLGVEIKDKKILDKVKINNSPTLDMEISSPVKRRLKELFVTDIEKLEAMIEKPLKHKWGKEYGG